jgi:hypothetical protein
MKAIYMIYVTNEGYLHGICHYWRLFTWYMSLIKAIYMIYVTSEGYLHDICH